MPTLLRVYLVGYYAVIAGAVITIWRSGLIAHIDRRLLMLVLGVAVLAGAVLAVASRKPDKP